MTRTIDLVTEAAALIPAARFHGADGKAVRPCTPAEVTYRHLRMLDIQPGHHILEIGTGSGYSAALLAHLTGTKGSVTTVDIEERLHLRAAALYKEHGHPVNAVLGDGLAGHPTGAPYDRILIGTTPPTIPDAWLNQLADGGRLITGCRIHDLPGSYAIARITRHGDTHDVTVHAGGYTPMITPATSNTAGMTTVTGPDQTELTSAIDEQTAHRWLAFLRVGRATNNGINDGDFLHLKNWILANDPGGLLAATTKHGTGIGIGDAYGSAALLTDTTTITSPGTNAADQLNELRKAWHHAGSPDTSQLTAAIVRQQTTNLVRLYTARSASHGRA